MKLNKQVLLLGAVVVLALGFGASNAAADASEAAPVAAHVAASATATASHRETLASTSRRTKTVKRVAVRRVIKRATPAQKAAAKAASIRRTTGERYVGTISGLGHATDVIQGSLTRTKAPARAGMAMTWGGATRMTTTDGLTSEIAGHAKSNTFAWIMRLRNGSRVSVTDAQGRSRSYRVYMTDNVNDDGYSVKNGADRLNSIISAHQGEKVVLQTCITNTVNRLVWAR
ncbi:sortase domain-bontaining protein [Lacticaseibacillus jixianensis]|uniref:Sortase domain-bontaining protein n=1 Tax=Lacticaseibacillus jixianensis TaxID=2486012 RepID=A0ABW4BAB2_9LACO|nr:sortase [Lacticaseibacillus jixianensis]